jgi:uncharacterized integral membrane protein
MTSPEPGTGDRYDVPGADSTGAAPGSSGTTPTTTAPAGRARRRGRAAGFSAAAALLVFVTVVLVLFVVFNTQTVDISLVFGDVRAPLIIALVIAAGLGGLLVGLLAVVRRTRRSRRS